MMNITLLGAGDISAEFMEGLKQTACATAAGVYNHDLAHAQSFAAKYGLPNVYDDYEKLLENDKADTIYVGLPNGLHYSYALKALQHGFNVIIEKPFCATVAEFEKLQQTADDNKVYLIEMDRVLAQPNFKIIKEKLADIGPVRMLSLNFCKYSRKYDALLAGNVGNVFRTDMAGGALYDLGVYGLHFLTGLFGMPADLVYRADQYKGGVDLSGCLIMCYDGFMADIMVSKNSLGDMATVVQGEKGTLYSHSPASVLKDLSLWHGSRQTSISADVSLFGTAYTLQAIADIIENNDRRSYQLRRENSRQVMELLCRCRQSAGIVFEADSAKID